MAEPRRQANHRRVYLRANEPTRIIDANENRRSLAIRFPAQTSFCDRLGQLGITVPAGTFWTVNKDDGANGEYWARCTVNTTIEVMETE